MGFVRYFGFVADVDRGSGVPDLRVEAWDVEGVLSDAVAITTTGADGSFRFNLSRTDIDRLFGGRNAVVKFKLVSSSVVLADTTNTHTWHLHDHARGRIDVNLSLPVGSSSAPRLLVRGALMNASTGAMSEVTIRAYDRNVGPAGVTETLLGSDTTDARGRYQITFENRDLGRSGKEVADLVVRAVQGETVIAERHTCAALPVTWVNLVAGGDTFHGPGEHAWLKQKLDGLRGGVSWDLLSAEQSELLACSSGVDRGAVDALIAAAKLAGEVPAVPEEAFYGLVRQGLPGTRVTLLSHKPSQLRKTLVKAIETGTVSHALESLLDDIEEALEDAAVLAAFDPRPTGVGLGTLISQTPGVSAPNQQQFVRKVLQNTEDAATFWQAIASDVDLAAHAQALQFTVEVSPLVANHTPMIAELHALRGTNELQRPDDLAKLLLSEWEALVNTTDVPPGTPGDDAAQKKANYAAWLHHIAEARFRTARIAGRISQAEPAADITTFFNDNPDFRFESTRVAKYLADEPTALDNIPSANRPAVTARLKKLERLFRVTSNYDQMKALDDAGLASAWAIHQKGKKRFVTDHAAALGGDAVANDIFVKSCWVVSASSAILGKYASDVQMVVAALPDFTSLPAVLPAPVADWSTLFGSADGCACEHCQSVLSASAYLVDLLQFLGRQPAGSQTGRDLLLEKRPDIAHLELSCKTSDTPLPYVDLVNEILELALASEEPPVTWPAETVAKTVGTAEELLVAPDVLHPSWHIAANNLLANAVYPFAVPFHLWNEEARVYLEHLGVPRWELMLALDPEQEPFSNAVVAERLGISTRQRAIIAGEALDGVTLQNLWGYSTEDATFPAALSSVQTFMRKAGLSYDQVLELAATGLYPTLAIPENAGCDLANITWDTPTEPVLASVHRFLRLQRVLGWSITDLAKAVTAFGDIDGTFLQKIAATEALRRKLGVDVPTVLSLFADIDRNGDFAPSLYERLFLTRTVAHPEDEAFRHVFATPNSTAEILGDHEEAIQVAVGASSAELDLVIDAVAAPAKLVLPPVVDGATAALNLANLSRVYRMFAFATALRLPVGDLRILSALSSTPVLAGASPANTLDFMRTVERVRQSRLPIPELHYVLRHVADADGGIAPTEKQLDQLLADLETTLARAAAEAEKASDPTGERSEALLRSLIPDQGAVDELIAIVEGTSGLSLQDRLDRVEAHLAVFFENVADAKSRLVGPTEENPNYLPTAQDRYDYLVRRLLRHAHGAAAVKQALAAAFSLPLEVVERLVSTSVLMTDSVPSRAAIFDFVCGATPPDPAGSKEARSAHLIRIHKASILVRRLRIQPEEFLALFPASGEPPASGLPWLDLDALPVTRPLDANDLGLAPGLFGELERLMDLLALRDRWPAGGEALFELLEFVLTEPLVDIEAAIAAQTSSSLADVQDLVVRLELTAEQSFHTSEALATLLRLDRALEILRKLGVSAESASAWADLDETLPVPNGALGALATTRNIQRAARAKYSAEAWPSIARPLRDVVRERHRDALAASLLARRDHERAAQLYEDLLIDVEMSPCMLTSRTVQAVAAAQLFVQRALLHLEGDFALDEEAAREWEWMKNYRVWEANRKVFLYPENWIEPELRDDKTPLFRDFETRLSQGPLTSASADKAFHAYLEGLHEIAHLDVVAVAEEDEAHPDGEDTAYVSAPRRILHIIARTSPPHVYYYRRHQEGIFSPWEKIDLDLPDGHLVPVVHNRRLHLFWPEVLETAPSAASVYKVLKGWPQEPGKFNEESEPPPQDLSDLFPFIKIPIEPPTKRLFMTMAYSEYKAGRWTKKRLSKDAAVEVPIDVPQSEPTPPEFLTPVFFLARSEGTSITIDACLPSEDSGAGNGYKGFARFTFDPCAARSMAPLDPAVGELAPPPNTEPHLQDFKGEDSLELVTDEDEGDLWVETIFDTAPSSYTLVAARGYEPSPVRNTVFYKDGQRTFLLERRTEQIVEQLPMSKVTKIVGLNGTVIVTQETVNTKTYTDEFFRAHLFYHPYACTFLKKVAQHGVDGLLRWAGQSPKVQLAHATVTGYDPNPEAIETPLPPEDVDFTAGGAYSAYNWEIFFHAPLLVATRLDSEQRYQEADRWYRYIFDPTDGTNDEAPARYWKVRPFYENKNLGDLLTELTNLAADEYNMHLWEIAGLANAKPQTTASESLAAQIATWRKDPFSPHAIARLRPLAYQKYMVMRYVDHLLSWGDQLFRMDTRESVAEATQLYVFASQILGPRPTILQKAHPPDPKTYTGLVAIDAFSNALVEVEAIAPPPPVWGVSCGQGAPPPETVWGTLYFCVPPNAKLLGYWDIVEDRLFKIRCCMNIDGTRRELPLFEPPIDPALLVKAKAAGVDIASVLADLNAGAPTYRFNVLHARAVELAGYVSSLGAGLLSALEKRDAEELSMLRTTHEISLAKTLRQVKKRQIDEAREQLVALERSRAVVDERRRFYAEIPKRIAPENDQLSAIDWAAGLQVAAEIASNAAVTPAAVPATYTGSVAAMPVAAAAPPSGETVSRIAHLVTGGLRAASYAAAQQATKLGIEAGYQRREAEWTLQKTLAERELAQIDKQIAAAQIRVAIAEADLEAHDQAIEQAREVEAFFRDKYTSHELYQWLIQQSMVVHYQAYRLAYQMALRAEKAYQYERGDDDDSFIRFDAWDSARSGLLAGERLLLDLRRLEAAYLERNKREYEITKHVSLAAHAPRELLALRETGQASFRLEEKHFDQDHPTHYLRRLKAVSLSVPCVTGPYQGVNAKLTLLGGETRRKPVGNDIAVSRGAIQSIVTSSGQNDGGQFELFFRDDRYLPFEGVGAHVGASASPQWDLKLSRSTNRFRFDSISDAILHVRYTARDGRINDVPDPFVGACLFSAKADFPDAWRAFQDSESEPLVLPFTAALFSRPEAMPVVKLDKVSFYTKHADGSVVTVAMSVSSPGVSLPSGTIIGALRGHETSAGLNLAPSEWQVTVSVTNLTHADLADIWIAVDYKATES